MAKIRKSFKDSFTAQIEEKPKKERKKIKISKFYRFLIDISSNFLKIVFYILICILVSVGATAIFNQNIRELILSFLK